jgi:hypothetical protein
LQTANIKSQVHAAAAKDNKSSGRFQRQAKTQKRRVQLKIDRARNLPNRRTHDGGEGEKP